MNQAEQQLFLDNCEKAFIIFAARNPQYEQTEENARRIAVELRALGLSPTNAEHIQIAWEKVRPAPALEPADPIEAEARRLIDSGKISLESINALPSNMYELNSRSAVFCRCVEILSPKHQETVLTAGDIANAVGQASLETSKGHNVTAGEKIREMENWKRKHIESISIKPSPGSGASRSVVNPGRDMPLPKSATKNQLDAAIKAEAENEKLLENERIKRLKVARANEYRASR